MFLNIDKKNRDCINKTAISKINKIIRDYFTAIS